MTAATQAVRPAVARSPIGTPLLPLAFERTVVDLVRGAGPDLSLRQLAVLLFLSRNPPADCTVRGLALLLNVSKPAITRAFDRLCKLKLMTRSVDKFDRRSVQGALTPAGQAYAARVAK